MYPRIKNTTMKKTVIILLLLALAIVAGWYYSCGRATEDKVESPIDTAKVLVRQVQDCARLYTAEMEVRKVVTHDDNVNFQAKVLSKKIDLGIPLGKRKVAIPMEATLKAYIDFSDFSEKNIRRKGDKIEVILPDPKVVMTHTKINNEEIKKNVPFLRSDFTDEEMTNYETQGRNDIVASIPKMNIIPTAQEGAAKVLVPLLEQLGFKAENITVTFRKEFTFDEIKRLIVND